MAVTDELGLTAQGLPTLERTRIRQDLEAIRLIVRQYDVARIVVGLPLQMSGREGRQAEWARELGGRIASYTATAVEFWDERLTSAEAGRVLRSSGISIGKRARAVDQLAAVLLLENYLARLAHLDSGGAGEGDGAREETGAGHSMHDAGRQSTPGAEGGPASPSGSRGGGE